MDRKQLAQMAKEAASQAYAPYSGHKAGAVILSADGQVYCGANIEIAGSTTSCCALRVAFIGAIISGAREFSAVAVTGDMPGKRPLLCGVCRQTLVEFCAGETPVYLIGDDAAEETTVCALLPGWPVAKPRWPEFQREPKPTLKAETPPELIRLAFAGRQYCYTPYSNYHVGAALLASSGNIYLGGNIEPAGRTSVICAERSALFQAAYAGERSFEAIAVVGALRGTAYEDFAYANPCAVCRQALCEFDSGEMRFYLASSPHDYLEKTLDEILPHAFRITSYH